MMSNPENFVILGFLIFVGILLAMRVPGRIVGFLDARRERIERELSEALRLRNEAEALLASFQEKAIEAQSRAESILTQARRDAEILAQESAQKLEEWIVRRLQQAEQKIALSEAKAEEEVRKKAADLAVQLAQDVLQGKLSEASQAASFIDSGIRDIRLLTSYGAVTSG